MSMNRTGSEYLQNVRRGSYSTESSVSSVSGMNKVLYIQMEYCEKKTLRDMIDDGIETERAWNYIRHMLEGLAYLHSQGIIHRDLKPSNLFLDKAGRIKIGDFGLATRRDAIVLKPKGVQLVQQPDDFSLTSDIGTPVYIAPEIMSKTARYNSKVDLYSLGIVFFEVS